jgi:hypothetical protein
MTLSGRLICAILIFLGCAAAPPITSAETGVTGLKPVELPDGKGKDDVEAYCSACHSLRLVLQQRLKRSDWEEVLVTMVKEHGMSEIPPDDRALVLDYLSEHLGLDRPPNAPPLQ